MKHMLQIKCYLKKKNTNNDIWTYSNFWLLGAILQ